MATNHNKALIISRDYPVWIVPENDVFNVPMDGGEIRFDMQHTSGPFASVRAVRGLAIEYAPGQVNTHIYFQMPEGRRAESRPGTVLAGVHTLESAAAELMIHPDAIWNVSVWPPEPSASAILHGVRTLTNVRESGYELEGRVSINGKKYRAFTSSELMQRPGGQLVSVGVLHICKNG